MLCESLCVVNVGVPIRQSKRVRQLRHVLMLAPAVAMPHDPNAALHFGRARVTINVTKTRQS
jgi:hypothetical protein